MVFQKYALGLQARVEWSVEAQQQGADRQLEQVGLSKACLGFLDALVARLQVGCQALLISHTQSSQCRPYFAMLQLTWRLTASLPTRNPYQQRFLVTSCSQAAVAGCWLFSFCILVI